MTIRIEITDPKIEDEKMLVATARFLMELAGHQMVPAPTMPTATIEDVVRVNEELDINKAKQGIAKFTEEVIKSWAEKETIENKEPEIACLGPNPKEAIRKFKEERDIELNKSKRKKKVKEIVESDEKTPLHFLQEFSVSNAEITAAVPPPPVEPVKMDFNFLIKKIAKLIADEKMQQIDILNIVRKHGLDKTHSLLTRPDLTEIVNSDIDAFLERK